MKWRNARESSNVEIGSGRSGGGGMKMGIGGIIVVVILGLVMGKNPLEMLGMVSQMQTQAPASNTPTDPNAPKTEEQEFSARILGSTEDVWTKIFADNNAKYSAPTMSLFSGSVQTACGGASSATGPFYCPGDQKVYLDTGFFNDMKQKLGGGGDFAQAYVIAHEVGHHIQTITGTSEKVNAARQRGKAEGANGLLVRQELQADCYAGLWAHFAQKDEQWMEAGDLESAIRTAQAIGDDTLQKQSQGMVVPDAFTHGSAEQRMAWFTRGFESGNINQCDTFSAQQL